MGHMEHMELSRADDATVTVLSDTDIPTNDGEAAPTPDEVKDEINTNIKGCDGCDVTSVGKIGYYL